MKDTIKRFTEELCILVDHIWTDIVCTEKCDHLPLFLMQIPEACYVLFDTKENCIVSTTICMFSKSWIAVEVDPINASITGHMADEDVCTFEMQKYVADMLFRCIRQCWDMRLSTEGLISTNSNGRFIAANLIE